MPSPAEPYGGVERARCSADQGTPRPEAFKSANDVRDWPDERPIA
ncbi:hypothetical protein [Streptomyces sp. bgisy031]